jgi:hypothetical protein
VRARKARGTANVSFEDFLILVVYAGFIVFMFTPKSLAKDEIDSPTNAGLRVFSGRLLEHGHRVLLRGAILPVPFDYDWQSRQSVAHYRCGPLVESPGCSKQF